MKLANLTIYSLLLLLVACHSTPDCPEVETTVYHFTPEEARRVAFAGKDTLVYVSNTGDTASCVGTGIQKSYHVGENYITPDCPPMIQKYEVWTIQYVPLRNDLSVQLVYSNVDGFLRILFDTTHIGFWSLAIDEYYPHIASHYSKVNLNGTNYSDVYRINSDGLWYTLYYNKIQGILKVETKGKTWTRVPN